MFGLEISTFELIVMILLILSEGLGIDKTVQSNGVLPMAGSVITRIWKMLAGTVPLPEKKAPE